MRELVDKTNKNKNKQKHCLNRHRSRKVVTRRLLHNVFCIDPGPLLWAITLPIDKVKVGRPLDLQLRLRRTRMWAQRTDT